MAAWGGNAPVAVQAELANEKLEPAQRGRLRQYADLIHPLLGPRHCGKRALTSRVLLGGMPNDLGPEHRLTLRQADQAREDFAQILDELNFVQSQIARLPTKREVRWLALRLTLGALATVVVALLLIR